jgi:hypothetical protein
MNVTTAASTLIYGASGTYKTTQIALVSEYVFKRTGRPMRLISAETAGVDPLQPYVDAGLIQPVWLHTKLAPRSALRKLIRGEWPVPVDKYGQPTKDPSKAAAFKYIPTPEAEWPGAYAFEGLTSISELLQRDLIERRASSGAQTGLAAPNYDEEGEKFGSSSQAHYGAVQNDIMFLLDEAPKQLFDASRGKVEFVFFTAHESKGIDETTRQPIFGPGTAGSAITNKIQKKVGTLLHHQDTIETGTTTIGGKSVTVQNRVVRAYFTSHPDPDNPAMIWQAKPRIPPSPAALKKIQEKWPEGYFKLSLDPPMGLTQFLEFQDDLRQGMTAELTARIQAMALRAPEANPTTSK